MDMSLRLSEIPASGSSPTSWFICFPELQPGIHDYGGKRPVWGKRNLPGILRQRLQE